MTEGHHDQADIVLIEAEIDLIDEVEGYVGFVGPDDPLGTPSSTRGIEVDPGLLGIDLNPRLFRRSKSDDLLIVKITLGGLLPSTDEDESVRANLFEVLLDGFHLS